MTASASICQEIFDRHHELLRIDCPVLKSQVGGREVLWYVDDSPSEAVKKPLVILSQGSWFPVEFSRSRYLPFGGFHEVRLIQKLLDAGFIVVAPRAIGKIAWTTNVTLRDYQNSLDYKFFKVLFQEIAANTFSEADLERVYATGVSSGGYNSSRLAHAFPQKIKALAIQSASYSDCLGPICDIPTDLGLNHPPTLFLHGQKDIAVPVSSAKAYYDQLLQLGVETEMFVDIKARHGWLKESPELIVDWFQKY